MTLTRRAALAAPLAALPLLSRTARAQGGWPSQTVRIIVPYTPGGASDIAARLIAEKLTPLWGQPVVVENRTGANGIVGSDAVAKAAPDGHTLGFVSVNHAVNAALYTTPFDTIRDFSVLTQIYSVPLLLVTRPDFPARSVAELAALVKAKPGEITFAGTGGAVHLAAEMFAHRAGAAMTHIPYRGSTAAHPDLIGGRVDLMFDTLPAVLGHVQTGKLRAIATTAAQRLPMFPDLPTVAEGGFDGFEASTWGAIIGPAGLPGPVAAKIATDAAAQLRQASVQERMAALGATPVGTGPEAAQGFVRAEVEKWQAVVTQAGIQKQ
ncbi:tripartite tricarboxylate transporter substrate binding protein [Pseudoroseomonas cervicalis]|uniref:Bug family tripartite tricarboxylate transporter substrate binding protein n=1 Tax=Teichococcus cervicalis TaxID=204525 RepID=UPI00278B989B|nr:tripartite tricarboxylate transporter substrate binding protein [Pseudoroseomonas cervicalis]MDQ1077800.1 tripartite-type tricarboxylate transporter receptor subunit TctC [Pseudoroseomonas cervicalis]